MEEFIVYRMGYKYKDNVISYNSYNIPDLQTALSLLERERKEDELVECFLVKEIIKREIIES